MTDLNNAAGPVPTDDLEPLTSRLARLGSMMREDEHKVLIAEAVETLHAAEEVPAETWTDRYHRRVLDFVGARGDVDLDTVSVTSGYEEAYRYSEYESGGGYFAMNVYWKEKAPRDDQTPAHADWDGLYPRSAELTNDEVARFLDSLLQDRPDTTFNGE